VQVHPRVHDPIAFQKCHGIDTVVKQFTPRLTDPRFGVSLSREGRGRVSGAFRCTVVLPGPRHNADVTRLLLGVPWLVRSLSDVTRTSHTGVSAPVHAPVSAVACLQ